MSLIIVTRRNYVFVSADQKREIYRHWGEKRRERKGEKEGEEERRKEKESERVLFFVSSLTVSTPDLFLLILSRTRQRMIPPVTERKTGSQMEDRSALASNTLAVVDE